MRGVIAKRFHDISVGHTVFGHESKCAHLHGHNYRVHFSLEAKQGLDTVGRVLDFSVIKQLFCEWLEKEWDHRFLVFGQDPRAADLYILDATVVVVPFNPTAENMATYLLKEVCPYLLREAGKDHLVEVTSIVIEETYKCHVEAHL